MNEKGEPKRKEEIDCTCDDLTGGCGCNKDTFNEGYDIVEAYYKPRVEELERLLKKQGELTNTMFLDSKEIIDNLGAETAKLQTRTEELEETIKDKDHFADDLIEHAGDLEKQLQSLKARKLRKDEIEEFKKYGL